MNNMFISYDLNKEKDYQSIIEEIKTLGNWAKVQKSFWYANTALTLDQVYAKLQSKIDSDDSLIVIDTSNNNAKWSKAMSDNVAKHMLKHWKN